MSYWFNLLSKNSWLTISKAIKFLVVLSDENLAWKDHIKYTEKKFSKIIGILYNARDYLSKLSLYYACIHTYVLCQFSMDKYDKNKLKENP